MSSVSTLGLCRSQGGVFGFEFLINDFVSIFESSIGFVILMPKGGMKFLFLSKVVFVFWAIWKTVL